MQKERDRRYISKCSEAPSEKECPESTSQPLPTLGEIRDEFKETLWENETMALVVPSLGIAFYILPSLLSATEFYNHMNNFLYIFILVTSIAMGLMIYFGKIGESGGQDEVAEAYDYSGDLTDWPRTFPPTEEIRKHPEEMSEKELQILLCEYEQICEDARYRDRLINRNTYFALAVIALYGAIIVRVDPIFHPILTALVSISMFIFAMAIVKYKDARDPLWKRQRDFERLLPVFRGRLTTFHTIRTPPRRLLDKYSMSSTLISIYLSLAGLTGIAYVLLLIGLPFGLTLEFGGVG